MIYYFKQNIWPHVVLYSKIQVLPGDPGDIETVDTIRPPESLELLEAYSVNDISGAVWNRSKTALFLWNEVGYPATEEEFEAVKNQFIKYQKDRNVSSNSN